MVPTQCLANILVTMNNEEFDTLHPFNLNQLPMSSVSIVLHASFLKELQEPYGLKALNLVKVGVKWCLSHGAACQRC